MFCYCFYYTCSICETDIHISVDWIIFRSNLNVFIICTIADEPNRPKMADQYQVRLDVKLDIKDRKQDFWHMRVSTYF